MKAVLWSKDNCQWCERVRQLFAHCKIDYLEYKLDKDFTRSQFIQEFEAPVSTKKIPDTLFTSHSI